MRFSARGSRLLAAGVVTLTFAAFLHVPALSQSPFAARQFVTVNGFPAEPREVLVQFVDMPAAVAAQRSR